MYHMSSRSGISRYIIQTSSISIIVSYANQQFEYFISHDENNIWIDICKSVFKK